MAGFLTEFLSDFAGVAMESWALKHLGDAQLAADAAQKARMADKLQSRWEKALVALAEKHRIALEMAPEVIAGGCLLLWGSNLRKQAMAIKLKGAELRAVPVQERAA
jgi:predicted NodU family carbamoyl transferase